jgi:serine/threonine protein phosphatase PrpC
MLSKEILNEPYFKLKNYPKALTSVFKRIDELLLSSRGEEELRVINKRLGGLPASNGEKISYRAGTTAIVLLMTKDRYYVANIGDSRAVLCRGDTTVALSTDHKPDLATERERIESAGGFVQQGRVNGTLGLSRSFGDYEYKHFSKRPYEQQTVVSVPDILEMERREEDQFLLLACDGVWERYVTSNQKMVSHLRQLREKHGNGKTVMDKLFNDMVAKELREMVGCDNMTAALIEFH